MALFCTNCGSQIPEGARFCPACGSPAPVQPQAPSQQYAQQQPVQQPAYEQAPYQQPAPYPGYDPNVPPTLPPAKKSNAGIIALITVLALAALGAGGWALYKYVLKPADTEEKIETSFSSEADEDADNTSFSTVDTEDEDGATATDSVESFTTPEDDEVLEDDPEGLKYRPQRRNGEPWGMTDEEAAQMRRNGRDIPQGMQRSRTRASRNNGEPWGMTDEEAAQMRRLQQRNARRNNGEPWGMTDEEAAQMGDNYGMPMGMTDEEAAQMRKMQRQQRRARRR